MRGTIFLTGGAGFVGRRVLAALGAAGHSVVALDRSGAIGHGTPGLTVVRGDLLQPETYRSALSRCDIVVHLAAATGRASEQDHFAINARGTETLLEECKRAGVSRILFVSSIAVTFPDLRHYHYARAKARAEAAVRESGLRYTILRPTIILGPGAPILGALEKLALLPLIALPGTGRARVHPVHVDDVARAIAMVVADDLFANETHEIGGPAIVTMEELLQRVRQSRVGRRGSVLRVPLWALSPPLVLMESAGLTRVLPITAGQLSSFRWDGVAAEGALQLRLVSGLLNLDDMLAAKAATPAGAVTNTIATPAVDPAMLAAECRVFTRHLVGIDPGAYVLGKYDHGHRVSPALEPAAAFDRTLVAFARRNALTAALADAYAAVFARQGLLRRKLVLLLAILETSPPTYRIIDRAPGGPVWFVPFGLAARGVLAVVVLAGAAVLLLPVHALASLTGRRSS